MDMPAEAVKGEPEDAPGRTLLSGDIAFTLLRQGREQELLVRSTDAALLDGFSGVAEGDGVIRCPATVENARALAAQVEWLRPTPAGSLASFGFGDRLGGATEGHLRALAASHSARLHPVLAQQSVRELTRAGRTAAEVVADAVWGAVAAGWTDGFGGDADHIQRPDELQPFVDAGYRMFTLDPHASVDEEAAALSETELSQRFAALPWGELDDSPEALRARYGDGVELETKSVAIGAEELTRAAVKYGRALVHVVELHTTLGSLLPGALIDVEVSVDESNSPTSTAEHVYLARELQRLGVEVTSLAPCFPGHFEKGVEYVGDLEQLRDALGTHAEIARCHGGYRLSLHSGSDKFSVYPLFAEATAGHYHVKTSGTSYLEALRLVAVAEPALFREIWALARDRYPTDRATYHVSAEIADVPVDAADAELPALLDDRSARQILHVTFGSVLGGSLRAQLLAALDDHHDLYSDFLERHFRAHLDALAPAGAAA